MRTLLHAAAAFALAGLAVCAATLRRRTVLELVHGRMTALGERAMMAMGFVRHGERFLAHANVENPTL